MILIISRLLLLVSIVILLSSRAIEASLRSPHTLPGLLPRHDRIANDAIDRRFVAETDCVLWATTDGWSTCPSLLTRYQVSMAKFYLMNPSVGENCLAFKPGKEYCIRMIDPIPVSTDGRCGIQAQKLVTCINSNFGPCCGKDGMCGSTDASCAIGNCQGGDCPGRGYSFDGKCGTEYGNLKCGGSWGTCCSKDGNCGSTNAECGVGNCQSGACVGGVSTSTTTTTSTRPLPTPRTPSPDGTCGNINRYICNGTNPQFFYGNCCSAAGYCGTTQYHCDSLLNCQDEFGLCDKTLFITVIQGTTTAGSTTTTASATPIPTPTPFIAGMVSNCDAFELVKAGDTCASIAATKGVLLSDFMNFNPGIPSTCLSGLWVSWYVCTSIVGHTPGPPGTVTTPSSPAPTHMSVYGGFRFWGCVTGFSSVSLLLPGRYADDYMTVEKCIARSIANGALWAGIEFGSICRYGTQLNLTGTAVNPPQRALSNCNMRCQGDTETYCGGSNVMDLFEKM